MKKITVLSLCFMLLSCSLLQERENLLNSYMGKNISIINTDDIGFPVNSFENPNGTKTYVYRSQKSMFITPGELATKVVTCDTYISVNKDGVAVDWRYSGNGC